MCDIKEILGLCHDIRSNQRGIARVFNLGLGSVFNYKTSGSKLWPIPTEMDVAIWLENYSSKNLHARKCLLFLMVFLN